MPEDYKTGKIYKEYWGIMPNVPFDKDNDLYSYIDMWIKEGREYKQKCNHNYFFRQSINYGALHSVDWGHRIKCIFAQETGVPVTPKELRKMYITYLNNKGATNTELKGAAQAMHHSQKMQEGVYNSQTIMDRIQPIQEFNERMFKEVFGSSSEE
jgi:integrase